jgi:predicted PurR-regulated permease PerM
MSDEQPNSQPSADDPPPRRGPPAPVVVPRWIQLVLLPVSLFLVWALARAAGTVLVIFLVAGVVALILNPLVKLVERGRLPHGVAVFTVYIGLLIALVGVGILLANPISTQVENFQRDVPHITRSANRSLADLQQWLDDKGINLQIKAQGQDALTTLEHRVIRSSGSIVSFARDLVQQIVQTSFDLILILVISVYMLVYGSSIGRLVRSVMPPGDGTPEDDYPTRVQKAVSGYVRGQLLFSFIMGATAGVALWLLGITGIFPDGRRYALFFAAFYGLMELVPYVGPVLGALPPIIVALFSDPLTAIWVGLTFLALQQVEGHIVAPQVFGHSLRINPLLIIFALLFGYEVSGIVGAFIALPLAAIARETVVYLRRHLVLEPWNAPTLQLGPGAPPPPPRDAPPRSAPPSDDCPACGEPVAPVDEFCRACGAPLHREVHTPG